MIGVSRLRRSFIHHICKTCQIGSSANWLSHLCSDSVKIIPCFLPILDSCFRFKLFQLLFIFLYISLNSLHCLRNIFLCIVVIRKKSSEIRRSGLHVISCCVKSHGTVVHEISSIQIIESIINLLLQIARDYFWRFTKSVNKPCHIVNELHMHLGLILNNLVQKIRLCLSWQISPAHYFLFLLTKCICLRCITSHVCAKCTILRLCKISASPTKIRILFQQIHVCIEIIFLEGSIFSLRYHLNGFSMLVESYKLLEKIFSRLLAFVFSMLVHFLNHSREILHSLRSVIVHFCIIFIAKPSHWIVPSTFLLRGKWAWSIKFISSKICSDSTSSNNKTTN